MDMDKVARLRKKANELPPLPGVYLMRDKKNTIIYIGKAKQLKNRVSSYFRSIENHLPKVYKMVESAENFEVIVTASEFEALVLECSLIKQHTPKYNILLKDGKGYSYVHIEDGDYPRIREAKLQGDKGEYIGPYMSGYVVKQTVDETNKVFMLPTCSRSFPRDFRKERPCLNFHMKQCMGVCRGHISAEEYGQTIIAAKEFIKGGGKDAIPLLEQRMEAYAEALAFEQAARCRDRINAIHKITDRQRVVDVRADNHTFIAFSRSGEQTVASVVRFMDHRLVDKEDFSLGEQDLLTELRGEFVATYYSNHQNFLPRYIVLDGETEEDELLEQLLLEIRGQKVEILHPKRGELVQLLEIARANAAEYLALMESNVRSGKEIAALDELGRLLGLNKPPRIIESYDISNISDSVIVGGMITFKDGKPYKAGYKRFKIDDIEGVDDYGSMTRMLQRRFKRYQEGDPHFAPLPDLILMDGGAGHLSVAKKVLAEFDLLSIPVFGMVKDNRHRTRAIMGEKEIAIGSTRSAFTLVSAIQEEVHRYAISYARSAHKKNSFSSTLTKIPTIGKTRATALFAKFKTLKQIANASEEELLQVEGMNKAAAQAVYNYFRENS